jgi:hypothetical protein
LMQNPNFKNMIPAFFEQEESEEMPNEWRKNLWSPR